MDRRESIKSLLVGSIGAGVVVAVPGCAPGEQPVEVTNYEPGHYGRTDEEKRRDQELLKSPDYFNEHEIDTISILCDLILPSEDGYQSASAAEVPDFIQFIVKDIEEHQLPLRGGLMWLDNFSNDKFNLVFKSCNPDQQKSVLDLIAYPEKDPSEVSVGIEFFSLIRNLTLTGFYTSKMGIEELGYQGNSPNVWDGVPNHVLKKHGFEYDLTIAYVDQSKRNDIAEWDDQGNLLNN